MPLLSTAREGKANGGARLGHPHGAAAGCTSRRSCWGRFLRSEHTPSWRTRPTHSALAWGWLRSSPGCLPLPGSSRKGEAQSWGAQAQADMLGHSTHLPSAQCMPGPLGRLGLGSSLLSCWAASASLHTPPLSWALWLLSVPADQFQSQPACRAKLGSLVWLCIRSGPLPSSWLARPSIKPNQILHHSPDMCGLPPEPSLNLRAGLRGGLQLQRLGAEGLCVPQMWLLKTGGGRGGHSLLGEATHCPFITLPRVWAGLPPGHARCPGAL